MSPSELNFLLSTPYFRKCSLTSIALFRNHLRIRHVQQGETIFQQGVVESLVFDSGGQVRLNASLRQV